MANLSKINWFISGNINYQAYDDDPYILTPNNINTIITGYNTCVDTLNAAYTDLNTLNALSTRVNNLTIQYNSLNTSLDTHTKNQNSTCLHVTQDDINKWNAGAQTAGNAVSSINGLTGHVQISVSNLGGVTLTNFNSHQTDSTIHVTGAEKTKWNNKVDPDKCVLTINGKPGDITINATTLNIVSSINNLIGNVLLTGDEYIKISTSVEETTNIINFAFEESLPIGTFTWWFGTADNIPDGWHICDGSAIDSVKGASLIKILNPNFKKEEIVYYPKLTDNIYIKGSNNAGTTGEAGLPNIKGVVGTVINAELESETTYPNGAFYKDETTGPVAGHAVGGTNYLVNMDASRCSDVYQDAATTVNPKHMTAIPIIYDGFTQNKKDTEE